MALKNNIHQSTALAQAGKELRSSNSLTPEQSPENPANEGVLSEIELENVAGGLNPQPIPPGQKLPKGNLV